MQESDCELIPFIIYHFHLFYHIVRQVAPEETWKRSLNPFGNILMFLNGVKFLYTCRHTN